MQPIQDKQFKLNDNGDILFQVDSTNPLPGVPVARLMRGAALLAPMVVLNDGDTHPGLTDRETAEKRINEWIASHIAAVIGPLVALGTADAADVETPVAQISRQLQSALGVLPRADIDALIGQLDADARRDLRSRRVRLGPVLVWMPDLTKPAAVRLRALLWALWNEKSLPVSLPPDGMVSVVIDPEAIDADCLRGVGYPVYGRRAIRIDMLDRVINAIYDGADKGVFKAKHEMAEWLGCPIAELYEILTAMGHTKISDPADTSAPQAEVSAEVAAEAVTEEQAPEAPAEEAATEAAAPEVATTEEPTEIPAPVHQVKPELATFRLRRGRAHESAPERERRPRPHFKKPDAADQSGDQQRDNRRHDRKKDDRNKDDRFKGDRNQGDRNKGDHKGDRKKPRPDQKRGDRDFDRDRSSQRLVASAQAERNDDQSPFAILNKLKLGQKE